ncbi:MAG: peptide chain release factor-like protein [bacterium]
MLIFPVTPAKQKELQERMKNLGVSEEDLEEGFIRASGQGGQKVNKSSSCVYLCHKPTGLGVKCQQGRSQILNRFYARRRLLDEIERLQGGIIEAEQKQIQRIRRQKQKRKRRAREKRWGEKEDFRISGSLQTGQIGPSLWDGDIPEG